MLPENPIQRPLLNHHPPHLQQILDIDILLRLRHAIPARPLHRLVQILIHLLRNQQRPPIRITQMQLAQNLAHPPRLVHAELNAIFHHDELAAPIAIAQRRAPGQIVHFARQLGGEVARVRTESRAAAAADRALLVADAGAARALLLVDFAAAAAHGVAPFGARGALAVGVAFEDYRAV